jgi:hypothetical protein
VFTSDGVASEGGKSEDSSNSVHSLNGSIHSNPANSFRNPYNNNRNDNNTHMNTSMNQMPSNSQQQSQLNIYSSNQSSTTNSNIEEDFNQYQLDGDFNDIESTIKISSSINNLNQFSSSSAKLMATHELDELDDNVNQLSLSSSNSLPIITANSQATKSSKQNQLINGVLTTNAVNGDNISKHEICSTNGRLVHVACQTLSTGDIMATNVFIA